MNLPPLAEYFTHIQRGTEPKAANLSYSLSTHLTSPAALENPAQEMAKSVRHSGGFLQKITWRVLQETASEESWGFPAEILALHPWNPQREGMNCSIKSSVSNTRLPNSPLPPCQSLVKTCDHLSCSASVGFYLQPLQKLANLKAEMYF